MRRFRLRVWRLPTRQSKRDTLLVYNYVKNILLVLESYFRSRPSRPRPGIRMGNCALELDQNPAPIERAITQCTHTLNN